MGIVDIILGLFLLKFTTRIFYTALVLCILPYTIVVIIALRLGGLFEPDVIWLVTLTCASAMYVGRRAGVVFAIITTGVFIYMMIAHINTFGDFNHETSNYGAKYLCFTLIGNMIVTFIVVYELISKNHRKELKLREMKDAQIESIDRRYKTMVSNSRDLISIVNTGGFRTFTSASAKNIHPNSRQLENRPFIDVVAKDHINLVNQSFNSALVSLQPQVLSYKTDNMNESRWVKLSIFPFIEHPNSEVQLLTQEEDVSDEVAFQDQLRKIKHTISRDFHDEIGNKLANLVSTASLLRNKTNGNPDLDRFISKIERNSNDVYLNFRDFIWSINSENESIVSTFEYLNNFFDEYLSSKNIAFDSETPSLSLDELQQNLPIRDRRNLVLIFKEAATNIIKYSKASTVKFSLCLVSGKPVFSLIDNGQFYKTESTTGMGIRNMRERAMESNFTFSQLSKDGNNEIFCQIELSNR